MTALYIMLQVSILLGFILVPLFITKKKKDLSPEISDLGVNEWGNLERIGGVYVKEHEAM